MDSDDMDMMDSSGSGEFHSDSEEILSDDDWKETKPIYTEQKSYMVMAKEDVINQSKELIDGVRELLSLSSSAAAAALLRHFKWNRERLLETYMGNPEKTLKEVGMGSLSLEVPPPAGPQTFACPICFDDVDMADTYALGCGHRYCRGCWTDFLEVQVSTSGPHCVYSQCMFPKCTELCHEECFEKLVSPTAYERYREFLHRSFIDQNPNVKWCPRPGCDHSVSCDRRGRRQPVMCACGLSFCFQCADFDIGNHLPATCESVRKWGDKNKDESENVKWMMANCLADDMQVLTGDGFVGYAEVAEAYRQGRLTVMQFEPAAGCLREVPAQDLIYNAPHEQTMVQVGDMALVTPEHDLFVGEHDAFSKVPAGSLVGAAKRLRMVTAAPGGLVGESPSAPDADVLRTYGSWLAAGGPTGWEYVFRRGLHSAQDLRVILSGVLGGQLALRTQSPYFANQVARLACLAGFSCRISEEDGGVLVVGSFESAVASVEPSREVREVPYNSYTWCVSVPSGLIVTRRLQSDSAASCPLVMGNCKRCPKCQKHIEKNGGCMHMTCRKELGGCGHDFCWLCRGPWSEHGSATGGYYSCNKYDASSAKKEDLKADEAKTELDQYMFYYHRYSAHRSAFLVAQKQHKSVEEKSLRLQKRFEVRSQDTKFLEEAADALQEERRVLMWSYCHGYWLKLEGERGAKEYSLYEHLQEQVEKYCDALSGLYERDEDSLKDYHDFYAWKQEVVNMTAVCGRQLTNFSAGVGEGLTEARF